MSGENHSPNGMPRVSGGQQQFYVQGNNINPGIQNVNRPPSQDVAPHFMMTTGHHGSQSPSSVQIQESYSSSGGGHNRSEGHNPSLPFQSYTDNINPGFQQNVAATNIGNTENFNAVPPINSMHEGQNFTNMVGSMNVQHRNQPGTQYGNQPGTQYGNQPGNQHGNQHGNQPGTQSRTQHGNQPGTQHGNQPGIQYGNQPGTQYGNQPGNQYGNQPGTQSRTQHGNQPGTQHGNPPGIQYGNQPGTQYGNQPGNQHGNQPGNQYGNQPGNQPGIQSGTPHGNQPENQLGNQRGIQSGAPHGNQPENQLGNQRGIQSGIQHGNQPGNQPGSQHGNQHAYTSCEDQQGQQGISYMVRHSGDTVDMSKSSRQCIRKSEDIWVAPSGDETKKLADTERNTISGTPAWNQFSIMVCLPNKGKLVEFSNITNADPTCFQFALQEELDDLQLKLQLKSDFSVEVSTGLLKLIGKTNDQDELEDKGQEKKRVLIRLVNKQYKCEELSIPHKFDEYVFTQLQSVDTLQRRQVIILHCGEEKYKIVGHAGFSESVADLVKKLLKDAESMKQPNKTNDDLNTSEQALEIHQLPMKPNDILKVRVLMDFKDVELKYESDSLTIQGSKTAVSEAKKSLLLQLSLSQSSSKSVPYNVGKFFWDHSDYIERCLQQNNIRCVLAMPNFDIIGVEALDKDTADSALRLMKSSIRIESLSHEMRVSERMSEFLQRHSDICTVHDIEHGFEVIMTADIYDDFQKAKLPLESLRMEPHSEKKTQLDEKNLGSGHPKSSRKSESTISKDNFTEEEDYEMETEHRIQLSPQENQFISQYVKPNLSSLATKKNVVFYLKTESNEIVLQGKASSVELTKKEIIKILKDLGKSEEVIRRFTVLPSMERKRKKLEKEKKCFISIRTLPNTVIQHAWLCNHLVNVVTVSIGSIEFAEADLMICPVGPNLLPLGVGCDIFKVGNAEKLQNSTLEYKESIKAIQIGHVAHIAASGNLHCQHLGLAVWPSCNTIEHLDLDCLQKMVENVVTLIMDYGCRTVAFPLFMFNASVDVNVAALFLDRFMKCVKLIGSQHYLQIHFYGDSEATSLTFTEITGDIFKKIAFPVEFHLQEYVNTSPQSQDENTVPTSCTLQVEIKKGSIVEIDSTIKLNAIVNSTTHTLDLGKGYVSTLLLTKAGDSIQKECAKAYPRGINFGDIAVTGSGNLKCNAIFHVALYKWIGDGEISSEVLKLIVLRCLFEAENRQFKSLAFPALGAGNLQYPTYLVARTMLETIEEFRKEYNPVYLEKVIIVLFPENTDLIEAFKNIQLSMSGSQSAKRISWWKGLNKLPANHLIQVHKDLGVKFVIAEKEHYQNLEFKEARLILNLTKQNEKVLKPQWEKKDNCFSCYITTDGSNSSLKDALKKAFDIVLDMKHEIIDVFLLSRELGSSVTSIQKQIETVTKIVIEKAVAILSTKNANKSQSKQPVCYVKMVRMFINSSEYTEMKESKKNPKSGYFLRSASQNSNSDFTQWHIAEMDISNNPGTSYKVEVYGDKTKTTDVLKEIRKEIEKFDTKPATGQWYICYLHNNREEAVYPEINKELNKAVNARLQDWKGEMKDAFYTFDLDNMECHDSQGKLCFTLLFKESKSGSKHHDDEQTKRLPGKAVRQVTAAGEAMSEAIDSNNGSEDDEMEIITSLTCEVRPDLLEKAKKMMKELNDTNLTIEEKGGKILLQGSWKSVKKAENLLKYILTKVEPTRKNSEENHDQDFRGDLREKHKQTSRQNSRENPKETSRQNSRENPKETSRQNSRENEKFKRDSGENPDHKYIDDCYEMTEDEYAGLVHYSEGQTWFSLLIEHKWINNKMEYSAKRSNSKEIQQCISSKVVSLRRMTDTEIILKRTVSDSELESIRRDLKELGELDCFLSVDKTRIKIMAENYEKAQQGKYKTEIKLGIIKQTGGVRKGRKFASNDSNFSTSKSEPDKRDQERDYSGSSSKRGNSPYRRGQKNIPGDHKTFHTKEGLKVLVYKDDILNLNVDCIVNAANADLQHGGGVAFFIAQAAGYELMSESDEYVRRNGPLAVGTCCTTKPGNLTHYHCIVHTVGPRWNDYTGQLAKFDCLNDLKQSIMSAIEEAAEHQHSSIAIPSISAGIFGVPKELCAQEYYRAVEEYSKKSFSKKSVKEVHFVDKDSGMCQLVQNSFTKCFDDKDYQRSSSGSGSTYQTGYTDDSKAPSNWNDRPGADGPTKQPKVSRHDRILTNQFVFSLDNKVNVKLVKGNITDSKTSVIVCPQDEHLSGHGRIAKAIHNKASEVYDDVNAMNLKTINLKTADVYPLKAGAAVIWKYIFHVVAPRWGLMSARDNTDFEKKLERTVLNILQRAKEYTAIESVAIPLMGVSLDETKYPTPVQTCCRCIVNGIMMYASKGKNLDIEIWGFDDAVVSTLREALSKKVNPSKTTDPQTNLSTSMHHLGTTSYKGASGKDDLNVGKKGSNDEFGKTMKEDTIKDESCCICMDNLTNPKKLTCGHIFCKECIDMALKHKPACPSCNFVFGKLTGNQPKGGTMHRYVDKYKDLPGYRGLGHIKINYFIPSGIQEDEHPNPGKRYDSISRPAYLPNNEKGRLVADLLETAFDQRLVFTIGQSRTSGEEGVVTWNDIHHKTRMDGGPPRFGYPDDTYLDRVLDELAAKGVTKDSLKSKR